MILLVFSLSFEQVFPFSDKQVKTIILKGKTQMSLGAIRHKVRALLWKVHPMLHKNNQTWQSFIIKYY